MTRALARDMAYAVVHELRERMHAWLALPVFRSDGLRLCLYALAVHFGIGSCQKAGAEACGRLRRTSVMGR